MHKFEILIECSESDLDKFETYFINLYEACCHIKGLNCKTGGANGRHSEETKKKMAFMSANCSAETRLKISMANKGRKKPADFGAKISKAMTGYIKTEEHKRNISLGKKGKPATEAAKAAWKASHIGRDYSSRKGKRAHNRKLILNIETGIYYDGVSEAAFALKLHRDTLCKMLNTSSYVNRTSCVYV